ncbi:peroxidase 20 isoform X2 [Momordica charantia]|uniref:peroxidase n=1 Tax=Momordica charantia TaxID=3673 RepID=A0A6J1DTG7_MOMCH|nr:peroxidase 20 isoform X2 [Momordica charantia]
MEILKILAVVIFGVVLCGIESLGDGEHLVFDYYKETCPFVEDIVRRQVEIAVLRDPRMAASLLRLHFHDCFVMRGGPGWEVLLGRKDSLKASFDGANKYIPSPNASLETLIANFQQQGLDVGDLVALSGSHTIGKARCLSFRQRVYQKNPEEEHDRYKGHNTYRRVLRSICPKTGQDQRIAPLDFGTPARFDNHYFLSILQGKGLLGSDNVLITQDYEGDIRRQVWSYASDQTLFFASFVKSIVKMGNINVLTAHQGEVRKNCRVTNY